MESTDLLDKKGIRYRLIKLNDRAVSCDDVVKFSDGSINSDEICKTIVVKTKKGSRYAFLLKGKDRLDVKKVKGLLGEKVGIVSAEELKSTTGVNPGAVCPLILTIPLFVDSKVFELDRINFGSGDHLFGIEISTKDLEVVEYSEADISIAL